MRISKEALAICKAYSDNPYLAVYPDKVVAVTNHSVWIGHNEYQDDDIDLEFPIFIEKDAVKKLLKSGFVELEVKDDKVFLYGDTVISHRFIEKYDFPNWEKVIDKKEISSADFCLSHTYLRSIAQVASVIFKGKFFPVDFPLLEHHVVKAEIGKYVTAYILQCQ